MRSAATLAPASPHSRAAAIQVGINSWMWSSGGLDDLINHRCAVAAAAEPRSARTLPTPSPTPTPPPPHPTPARPPPPRSCDPNLGLFPVGGDLYVISRRAIAADEELSFDYSTSMVDEPWAMQCACGEAACRGTIANFLDLPAAVQTMYASNGMLPEHVALAYLTRGAGAAAGLAALPLDPASPAARHFHVLARVKTGAAAAAAPAAQAPAVATA